MIALKITEPAEDLKIPPELLFEKLLHATANLDTLVKDLGCTVEDIVETLTDTRTSELLRIKAQLASMQVKLLAIRYMPHATARLVQLTEAEKPEVARRACNTVINMAGVPTETKSQPPTLTLDKQEEVEEDDGPPAAPTPIQIPPEEALRILGLSAFANSLKIAGLDIEAADRLNPKQLAKVIKDLLISEGIPFDPNPPGPRW
jgi:hypothetical protein